MKILFTSRTLTWFLLLILVVGVAVGIAAFVMFHKGKTEPDETHVVSAATEKGEAAGGDEMPLLDIHDSSVDATAGLKQIMADLDRSLTQSNDAELADFELYLREQIKSGWKPTWSELQSPLSGEQLRQLDTEELTVELFASGLPARTFLIYERPAFAMKRLEVAYPGYKELFRREDAWRIPIALINMHLDQLRANASADDKVTAIVGLTALPEIYAYEPLRAALAGREGEIIHAHIRALQALDDYLKNDVSVDEQSQFFSATAPTSLVHTGLMLGRQTSEDQYEAAVARIAQQGLPHNASRSEIRQYIQASISALNLFVR